MPTYDIDCPDCGLTTTVRRMNDYETIDGITHRRCRCGQMAVQKFLTPPNGFVDGPADAQPFQVAGIEGTFKSHRHLERFCRAANMDITHTGDASFKKTKSRAKAGAEALATEMGYSSLGQYQEKIRDPHHIAQAVNETKERQGRERD